MDYLKSTVPKNTFRIYTFLEYINAEDKEEAGDTFKELVKKLASLQKTKENRPLKVFAKRMKKYKFRILESHRAYKYWNEVALQRLAMKKMYYKTLLEESAMDSLIDEIGKGSHDQVDENDDTEDDTEDDTLIAKVEKKSHDQTDDDEAEDDSE